VVTIVKAKIKLYKKENGRKTPFTSGYRPIFSFENQEEKTSGQIILIDREEFRPDEEGEVQIHFLSKFLGENFGEGVKFTFSEGMIALGEGWIEKVLSKNE
jgi:translation elongation factor EF-Tu-like GTPase